MSSEKWNRKKYF